MLCKSHYVFIFYDTATTEIDTYDTLFPYTTLFRSAGISVVLIPMDSDGIEVRPIRRNNGDYHFNEVFFDNVRVPLDNIVGSMNDGWRINRTTMVGEHLTNFLEIGRAHV